LFPNKKINSSVIIEKFEKHFNQFQQLKSENDQLKKRIQKHKLTIKNIRAENEQFQKMTNEHRSQFNQTKEEIDSLTQSIKQLRLENENLMTNLKSVSTKNDQLTQQLSVSSLKNLHPLIQEGMSILIQNSKDKKKLEECFKLFLQYSNQFKHPQAFWRVLACYGIGIGTERNLSKSFEYAKKAKEHGLIEGIFWFCINCYWKHKFKETYQFFD
jgi:TPR repeat protein